MLHDSYQIRGDFRQGKRVPSISLKKFLNWFAQFNRSIQNGKKPDILHQYCDPYGFALLCNHYNFSDNFDLDASCHDNFKKNKAIYSEYKSLEAPFDLIGSFPFNTILNYLHIGYWFDKKLAIDIFNAQQSPLSIFKQIMAGQGFIQNRYRYDKARVRKYMNYALESKIALDEEYPIPIPYTYRVCDGMVWPCIVTRNYFDPLTVETIDLNGWGDGLFVTQNKNIVDVLRINDLWLTDTPLENRLKFAYKIRSEVDYNIEYVKVWNWRDAIKAGKLMGANSTDGLLLRSSHENYLNNRWFVWSRTSSVYCYNIKNVLRSSGRGNAKPNFYTLEGDLAYVSPYEEKKIERVWLDDFDIKEFQKILELK